MKKNSVLLLLSCISSLVSAFAQNPGDTLFNSSHIHNINITFTQPGFWDSLMHYKQHADSFNLNTQTMMGNFYLDGALIDSVGVQLKGNSSFGFPGRKKPIKISLNQYVSGKKLEGLTAIDLNNNVLDPTMMREKLMLDFMHKKGLAAPRCTYAKVSYNGQYVGLYKIIEQVNKEFIKTHFSTWGGNLFKGDPQGSLYWVDNNPTSYYPYYELHSNKTANNWGDLVSFIDHINHIPSTGFYDTLETDLNTTPMIQQWAARNLFVDLDGYFHAPHNYYLYHDSLTNKFEWCSWDLSQTFGSYFMTEDSTEHISLLSANGLLTQKMLANSTYKTTYLNTICDYLDYLDTTVMNPIIDSLAAKIYPAFCAEPDSNQMFPEQMFYWTIDTMSLHLQPGPNMKFDIPGLKKFITKRRNNVLAELASLPFTCTTGINENENTDEILVYPNPSNGQFVIASPDFIGAKQSHIEIYNVLGEKIYSLSPSGGLPAGQAGGAGGGLSIDLSEKPNNIYFLHIKTSQGLLSKKIIISK